MGKRLDGTMGLFLGITRSGKSTPIKALVKKVKRVLVWDAKNEYGPSLGFQVVKSLPELLAILKRTRGNGRFAFVPTGFDKVAFDHFCRLAHTWNRQKPAVIVIEELAAVTHAGKASGYWGVLVNQSLGLGATLLATVQRGQEVDKSVMNAASYLYVCQHNTDDDAKYIAKKLGVPLTCIPRDPLKFLVWSPSKGAIASGQVTFPNNAPAFSHAAPGRRKLTLLSSGKFQGLAY
ncbi:MAG: hypothetical protein KTR20_14160 [Cellvibrionaceae bacterium]|nr:hypothetical protein [Cellvibrionaceae bacterium]